MQYTTFFPTIVWRFSLFISSFLVCLYMAIDLVLSEGKILDGILAGALYSISHFVCGCIIGFIFYIFFARIGNTLIKKGKTNFEKKLYLNIYGFLISMILWFLNLTILSIFSFTYFFAIPFFISMTFAIWFYEIKMEIVPEESVEGILDDNFITRRK